MDPMEARLAQLHRLGGESLIADLIDLFAQTVPERLVAAREAQARGDLETVARVGHSLTSTAGNLGVVDLQELAAALEERARVGDAAPLGELLTQMEMALERACTILAARRKGTTP